MKHLTILVFLILSCSCFQTASAQDRLGGCVPKERVVHDSNAGRPSGEIAAEQF